MKTNQSSIIQEYSKKCGSFTVSSEVGSDDNRNTTYIDTDRFTATTLFTKETQYEHFPEDIKNLIMSHSLIPM